ALLYFLILLHTPIIIILLFFCLIFLIISILQFIKITIFIFCIFLKSLSSSLYSSILKSSFINKSATSFNISICSEKIAILVFFFTSSYIIIYSTSHLDYIINKKNNKV